MISAGYGDAPSYEEIERLLAEEEEFFARNARAALVRKLGRGFAPGADADAIQEARIAAWQSWQKHKNRAYMNIAVKQRLLAYVLREAPPTGADTSRSNSSGASKDPLRRPVASIDDPDLDLVLVADQVLEVVAMAYHDGEIVEAINSLTESQREYCVLRFWCGMTDTEIAAVQGKTRGGVSSAWHKSIRPALKDQLVHLHDLVGA